MKPISERPRLTSAKVHNNPLLNRIYQNRGVGSPDELEYELRSLISPSLMKDIEKGADIIISHILAGSKILILGDYDCDGATSTAIAVEGLTMHGAKSTLFLVPDRQIHGYGLTKSIAELAGKEKPDLIITVDNGISAFEGAQIVKEFRHPCQLIITDHHLVAESGLLPDADAIINPNQPDCGFPSKNLAGCGVIFYTILALRKRMREKGVFEQLQIKEPNVAPLLDLVALGTVADVVKLDYNNRIIVNAGLSYINKGHARAGIKKILELKGKKIGEITSSDFGFSVGPCINAAGRLEDMTIGIKCLLTRNESIADELATRLVSLNEQRKEIEHGMVDEALSQITDIDDSLFGLAIYHESWHEGVVGIVASRIKDRMSRPVICATDTHELTHAKKMLREALDKNMSEEHVKERQAELGKCFVKGSARSVNGVHLKHVLDEMNKKHPEIIYKFGGHAMAAGLSVEHRYWDRFCHLFNETTRKHMTVEMLRGLVEVDIKNIDPSMLTIENTDIIQNGGPWGAGFESPTFSACGTVMEYKILKDKHLKLKIKLDGGDKLFDAIAFNCVTDPYNHVVPSRIETAFQMSVNEFNNSRNFQLLVRELQEPAPELTNEKTVMSGLGKRSARNQSIFNEGMELI